MSTSTLSLVLSPPTAPGGGEEEYVRVLNRLLTHLSAWVRRHGEKVSEAFLVVEPDGLMLYVVGREEAYNFELGDELSEFSIGLADQGLNVGTTLLPASSPEELRAFFDPQRGPAIRIPAE